MAEHIPLITAVFNLVTSIINLVVAVRLRRPSPPPSIPILIVVVVVQHEPLQLSGRSSS